MEESSLIKKVKAKIDNARGKSFSLVQRAEEAVALAALMLEEARRIQTPQERRQQELLAGMMRDPIGKVFTTAITDQCFRSQNPERAADQLIYLIQKHGIPHYLPTDRKIALKTFKTLGKSLAKILIPFVIQMLRKEMANVILSGEENQLIKHIEQRHREGVQVNLNHLGEAILGEEEANHRLQLYLRDLAKPQVECISVKISTLCSQINLLAWEETLEILANRLRQLYRAAMTYVYTRANGERVSKLVNLDMEEYRDLRLTVALFCKVLDEKEFYHYEAGIVLQSYLPDAFLIQQELTRWAMQRMAQGGASIRIRLVKGANLAMEQVEASIRIWPQTPYTSKAAVDANYKRMVAYGCQEQHAKAAHLGIGSHNLFDITYALLLRAEHQVEKEVSFEMLEGMADPMRRVVQQVSGSMLLYCPTAIKEEFQNAVAYLIRRLDENTAPENFLHHAFNLIPGTLEWEHQASLFTQACLASQEISYLPRRTQNRLVEFFEWEKKDHFQNEPDTDWSLPQNRRWAEKILQEWSQKRIEPIPLVIGGQSIAPDQQHSGIGKDPSRPGQSLYQYTLASSEQVDQALNFAKQAEKDWAKTSIQERSRLLAQIAQGLRRCRADLIGAMIADTGKTVPEADFEVSEAIDFAEYYRHRLKELYSMPDIQWQPKGTVLVAPPWNFPCSIPAGCVLASLATGNCVILKPANEAILVGWRLAQVFWEAGVSQQTLQFMTCEDDPVGSQLIQDPRISTVILTGATATAKFFLRLRPSLDLIAETGGKNTLVISAMADRDLAIRDLVQSAFSHAGQKCSACSLAILEAEVYDDPHFREQLCDAVASLPLGSSWDFTTRLNPLILPPNPILLRGLTQLEEGEEWLLKPQQHPHNPHLWSPGIKLGVKPGSFTFENELFGPVLGLVRADHFEQALDIMNQTPYGLTAGIHSLDEREQHAWLKRIEAGNCYINRTITGAIVQRQPFGGYKDSSFGKGAKAGGPNYLTQLMQATQLSLPIESEAEHVAITSLTRIMEQEDFSIEELQIWKASIGSYAFHWSHLFSKRHDPSLILGQDNFQQYASHPQMTLRVQYEDRPLDILRVAAAALTCGTPLEISDVRGSTQKWLHQSGLSSLIPYFIETEDSFIERIKKGLIKRIRLLSQASDQLQEAFAQAACYLNHGPVLANGRLELLHYLREVSVSINYHRYGNLGDREKEKRSL